MAKIMIYPSKYVQGPGEMGKLGSYAEGYGSKALVLIDGYKDADYVQIVNELCPTLKSSKPGELNNPMLPFLKTGIYAGEKEETPAGSMRFDKRYSMAAEVA